MNKQEVAAKFAKQIEDPFEFIKIMWGLTPQPVRLEFKERLEEPCNEWKAEWFGWQETQTKWRWHEFEKGKHLTWQQTAVIQSIKEWKEDPTNNANKVTIASGNGIGKSCLLAWLNLWFLFVHKNCKIGCTANTAPQLNDVLWAEIRKWIGKMPESFSSIYEVVQGYVSIKENPKEWFARARTARKEAPEAFAGIHADSVMLVADEASGIPEAIFESGKGAMTAPTFLFILTGNPTRPYGYFRTTHRDGSNWARFKFSSIESPVVDEQMVLERLAQGESDFEYQCYVLGNFPPDDALDKDYFVSLFTEKEIEEAQTDSISFPISRIGIDPSGQGRDKTAFVGRDAFHCKILAEEQISTPLSIVTQGLTLMMHSQVTDDNVFVDSFGVGSETCVKFAESGHSVIGINVGDKSEESQYENLRSEAAWRFKRWIAQGGKLIRDRRWKELCNVKYKVKENGKMVLMSKEKMQKEGIRSPNFFDAAMLTFVRPEIQQSEARELDVNANLPFNI